MDFPTRRTFLAAGAGALAFSPAAGAANDRTTLGFVGCGARAHQLIENAKKASGVEIVSLYDAYSGRLERARQRTDGRAKVVNDYRLVIEDPELDAVVIASPDHWHARQCIEALEAGKDVYCEKPLTFKIDEGLEIAAAVKRTGQILQVGSQGISSVIQQQARDLVQSGKLGQVTMVRANYNRNSASGAWLYPIPPDASPETVDWETFLGPAPKRPFDLERFFRWRCYREYSGGIATDLFVHLCTTIHYVMGAQAPKDVFAMGDLYRWTESRNVPDTLNAILRYPEGFTVTLSSTFNNGTGGQGFEFLGTEGSVRVGYTTAELLAENVREVNGWITDSWPEEFQEAYYEAHPEELERRKAPEPEEFKEPRPGQEIRHMQAFIDAVRARRQPVEDVWAGHRAAACAHLINKSARTGKTTHWDFEKDREKT